MMIHDDVLAYAEERLTVLRSEEEAEMATTTGTFIRGQIFELEKLIAAQVGS